MKIQPKLILLLILLFMMSKSFPVNAGELSVSANAVAMQETPDIPVPNEAPMFCAAVEYYSHGYYVVKGTFTEFLPDTILVRPLYSLDDENWQPCGRDWDLHWMNEEGEAALTRLHNQICLDNSNEPLKSYLSGELDLFYLKLQITRANGETCETQTAVIERGAPQPISKEIEIIATFAPSMRVREMNPANVYGRYQITINAGAAPEDISAFLPDTLPIVVGLYQEGNFITEGIINCPITWKSLPLSQLTAGESITIPDAAEEIIIPGDTLLSTPMGIFQLDEPLGLNHDIVTDEIRLILNVVSETEEPTGVLAEENEGLELAFQLKPTGAAAIRAYTFTENDKEWKALPALSLLDTVNEQPSTANSGYALIIHKDWEPYQSYLAAKAAGESPVPFLIGLKIEGGVYDGRQLILSWPSSYDLPANLPVLGGSGGNEGNAGTDNKNDSTEEGQRPELPQQPEEKTEEPETAPTQKPKEPPADPAQEPEDFPAAPTQEPEDSPSVSAQRSENAPPAPTQRSENAPSAPTQEPENKAEARQQERSQVLDPARTEEPANMPSDPEAQTDTLAKTNTTGKKESPTALSTANTAADTSIQGNYNVDAETDAHGPFLPIAAASAAGICIIAAVHRAMRRSVGTP